VGGPDDKSPFPDFSGSSPRGHQGRRTSLLGDEIVSDMRTDLGSSVYLSAADPGVYPSWVPRKVVIGRNPWRWAIAAIGLVFAGLELPEMFGPLPDYAQHDNFELFMFYAVPALITAAGLGFAFFALRSGVLADAHGLVIRPAAGMRSKRVPVEAVRAVTVTRSHGPVFASVSPALIHMDGDVIDLGLARYDTPGGRRRAQRKALNISQTLDRPFEIS
jgi:hypothetical protein